MTRRNTTTAVAVSPRSHPSASKSAPISSKLEVNAPSIITLTAPWAGMNLAQAGGAALNMAFWAKPMSMKGTTSNTYRPPSRPNTGPTITPIVEYVNATRTFAPMNKRQFTALKLTAVTAIAAAVATKAATAMTAIRTPRISPGR